MGTVYVAGYFGDVLKDVLPLYVEETYSFPLYLTWNKYTRNM